MKKSIVIAIMATMGLTACGKSDKASVVVEPAAPAAVAPAAPASEATPAPAAGGAVDKAKEDGKPNLK